MQFWNWIKSNFINIKLTRGTWWVIWLLELLYVHHIQFYCQLRTIKHIKILTERSWNSYQKIWSFNSSNHLTFPSFLIFIKIGIQWTSISVLFRRISQHIETNKDEKWKSFWLQKRIRIHCIVLLYFFEEEHEQFRNKARRWHTFAWQFWSL